MTESVLLLAPSRDLGGGIERYVSTIESAFARHSVNYRRLDLRTPDRPPGLGGKVRFVQRVRRAVRSSERPVRLVLAHRNLLPVVSAVSRLPSFRGASVILHGAEVWSGRWSRGRRQLRRHNVRAVAVSNFSAGALARICPANVLPPSVSPNWYSTLVRAGDLRRRTAADDLDLMTAFRLSQWRDKGFDAILKAVRMLDWPRLRITVCGHGPAPPDLRAEVARHPYCRVIPDLSDEAMAAQFADADVFVLGTRTRPGANSCGEGFGLVLLEAQLTGTPVVAPAYGGSGDAFQPGLTGVAPIDETPQALAVALAELLRDEPRRIAMGRAAAAWSRAQFEPEDYSRRVVRILLSEASAGSEQPHVG